MKHAYVSLIVPSQAPLSAGDVAALDTLLLHQARLHEIVNIVAFGHAPQDYSDVELAGPVTTVVTHIRATPDAALVAGLSRAVGDFLLEWQADPSALTAQIAGDALRATDEGAELVNLVGKQTSAISRFFYFLVNVLRPPALPVRKTVGRVYSRHAVGQVISAAVFEPQIAVLTAELPVARSELRVEVNAQRHESLLQRIGEGGALLARGTRFGSAVPLGIAGLSAMAGLGAAVYALLFFFLRGQTPEGWTTLMILMGLGMAAIMGMLGLIWSRIDSIVRGMSQRRDATGAVFVTAATKDPDE